MIDLHIGDKVWMRMGNVWEEHTIIGETRVSWIVSPDWAKHKIPKNPKKQVYGWAYSEAECKEWDWVKHNAYWIADTVSHIHDHDLLREIARLIDYKERS